MRAGAPESFALVGRSALWLAHLYGGARDQGSVNLHQHESTGHWAKREHQLQSQPSSNHSLLLLEGASMA
jgi:hypothetical protein